MPNVQKRGVPQLETLLNRFGWRGPWQDTEIPPLLQMVAPVQRLDLLCAGYGNLAAVAANVSQIQLFNPAGSNITIICHRIGMGIEIAGDIQMAFHDTELTTLISGTSAALNRSPGTTPDPTGQIRHVNGAAVGTIFFRAPLDVADRFYWFDFERAGDYEYHGISLAPGRGLIVRDTNNDIDTLVQFEWSERVDRI